MTVIAECLNRASPGEAQHYQNLTRYCQVVDDIPSYEII